RSAGGPPPTARLENVDSGTATLNPNTNAVITIPAANPPLNEAAPEVRAIIELPRPRTIFDFRLGNVPQGALANQTLLVQPPSQLSQVHVLEYTCAKLENLTLSFGGVSWTPQFPAFVGDREVVTLHIYEEPSVTLPPNSNHNDLEFGLSTGF